WVKVDNGRDYSSERYGALLRGLDIEADFSTPFSPWEKPHIERGFHTFSHGLLTLLPGYVGHDVAEAQSIRARKAFADRLFKKNEVISLHMTAADLQKYCDQWCEQLYAHEPHAGLDGMTPFQAAASLRDTVRMIGDVRALDVLMGAGRMCSVTKRGIRVDKLTYIAEELGALDVGTRVLVRRDDGDIGRIVVYYDDAFYCLAECPDMTGINRAEVAVAARQMAKAKAQEERRQMRASARRIDAATVYAKVLADKEAKNSTLAALPPPNVVHLTPQLAESARAADALDRWEAGAPSPEQQAATTDAQMRVVRDEHMQGDDGRERFEDALQKLQRRDALDDVTERRLQLYLTSAEFIALWQMLETEGAEWLGLSPDYNALLPADAPYHHHQGAQ
ncbi:MAG: Mu transposase C-terminal domain-containing protein, partial [Pseudomonadota bacterium]|nr:Mu transposase C-terminal domain-containing protein [Pseudomonadota bacterium]